MPTFYEFFAGGGMARAGLGDDWSCRFSNDFDHKKAETYRDQWGNGELVVRDIAELKTADLPGTADLAWASFPCQDLSLAGGGAGLKGERSGTFRPFWQLIKALIAEGRGPKIVVLENVCGTLTSHSGKDFEKLCSSLVDADYQVGALVIDAVRFVPQSRPRLFIVGVKNGVVLPDSLLAETGNSPWHTQTLLKAYDGLSASVRKKWLWLKLPVPLTRKDGLIDLLDRSQDAPEWFSQEETDKLLMMMSPINRAKVTKALKYGKRIVGSVYKRTRININGEKQQRAEIRFDGVSGCLRTPAGGSSRQILVFVEDNRVRARLISARETARLMGLAESYVLPKNYNEAYHLTGDGVVVPVVRFLAEHILEPIVKANDEESRANAA